MVSVSFGYMIFYVSDVQVAALTTAGVSAEHAEKFVDALHVRVGSANISIFHKPTDDTMEGGSLAFIDAGMAGYWQTDVTAEDAPGPRMAVVTSVDASVLAKQVLEFLPEAFGDMVPCGLKSLLG